MSNRLTARGITIAEVLKMSYEYYKSKKGDDKSARSRLDIQSAKLIKRNNFDYDRKKKEWVQSGRDFMFLFIIRSRPTSYKSITTIKNHYYPIYFLIHDYEKGMDSTFRFRSTSLKHPIWGKKGDSKQKRVQIANKNTKNGCQMQFVTELMYVLKQNNLLYGINFCTRPPVKKNPNNKIFFDKHSYSIVMNILINLLNNPKFKMSLNKVINLQK